MVKIIGHRGAAGYSPENTISSFKEAIRIGCHRTELDVKLTKDNHLVVFHDNEISELTNGEGYVNDLTLAELKEVYCDMCERIPTLQEVIDVCKNKINLQIELKDEGTEKLVNDLIIKNDIEYQVVISSFKIELLKEIKKINSRLKVGFLFRSYEELETIWDLVEDISLDFLAPSSEIITEEFVNRAHEMGKKVYTYRVNSKELGDKLVSIGVDELGTDFPEIFIKNKETII